MRLVLVATVLIAGVLPAFAQVGEISEGLRRAQQVRDLVITEQDERDIGAAVSERLRTRYGVAQDVAIHRYVSLDGTVLTSASARPGLPWQFIVLDTDAVDAFAAPGGFVHITKGALALAKNEAELAGVLGHEIAHVVAKHTINAIKKSKLVGIGADELGGAVPFVDVLANKTYELLLENAYDRKDELWKIITHNHRWSGDHIADDEKRGKPAWYAGWPEIHEPRDNRAISDIIVNVQTGTGNRIEYWDNHGTPFASKGKIRRYIDIPG